MKCGIQTVVIVIQGMLLAGAAWAVPSTGDTSCIVADSPSAGGGEITGAVCVIDATIGDGLGIASDGSAVSVLKTGFTAQLFDIRSLQVAGSSTNVAEGGTVQLTAVSVHDDATFGHPEVTWSAVSGPIASVSTAGLVQASVVYQDAPGVVQAVNPDAVGSLQLTVLDTLKDNYGLYADDSVMDSWQFQYFGLDNTNALASADPDGDGQNNLMEFTTGTAPTNATSGFDVRISPGNGSGKMNISFYPASTVRSYTIQARTNLLYGQWSDVVTVNGESNGVEQTIEDMSATNRTTFYRTVIRYDW